MYVWRFIRLTVTLLYLVMYYLLSNKFWNEAYFINKISNLGPLVIKLGQIMSVRPDLCSTNLAIILAKLRINVTPINLNIDHLVGDVIDSEPLACGSIAQIYFGILEEEWVIFKVLKKDVISQIFTDLCILKCLAKWIDYIRPNWRALACVTELGAHILKQTDFQLEAENMELFRQRGFNIPKVYYYTKNVLCMQYIKTNNISKEDKCKYFVEMCRKMMSSPCLLHLDLHPGNVIWTTQGVYLLDMGLVQHVDDKIFNIFMDSILATLSCDYITLAKLFVSKGNSNPDGWIQFVGSLFGDGIDTKAVINIYLKIIQSCHKYNITLEEKMSGIIMTLVIINGHYNEICDGDFIQDILIK